MAYTTIDDPSAYFQTVLWTGNGSTQSITFGGNSDLQPDWLWFKRRNGTNDHNVFDTTRGLTERQWPNLTSASDSGSNGISALTDGFTSGTFYGDVNSNGNTFVTWQWKCNGGTTTTNDASSTGVGNVDSVYQANTTAGFSIVTFDLTGDSGDKTIAHGLGQAPDVIFFKNRDDARNWAMHHHTQTPPQYMTPNTNAAVASSDNFNNSTDPTSTVFSLETSWHGAHKHVAYCFAEVQGYSKFGSYKGNGGSQFVYTGFAPAFLIEKRSSNTSTWTLYDNKRSPFNERSEVLHPEGNDAEETYSSAPDFLSNGFAPRGAINDNGETVIYMAFAEHPFVSSEGVPCTAR